MKGFVVFALFVACLGSRFFPEPKDFVLNGFKKAGRVSPSQKLSVFVALKTNSRSTNALKSALYDVSLPNSKNYGNHMSLEEIQRLTSPAQRTVKAVREWLQSAGISSDFVKGHSDWLKASGTVRAWERALETTFYTYEQNGVRLPRCESYSVPMSMREHVDLIADIKRLPQQRMVQRSAREGFVTPSVLRTLWNVPSGTFCALSLCCAIARCSSRS